MPFILAEPVREVLGLLSPAAAEKGIAPGARIDPALPERVVGDPLRLQQVLLNLVDNAVKFTSVGGVEVRLEPAADAAGSPRLRAAVADTGIGIAPAVQARLFRRFEQGEAGASARGPHGGGGSGLGLYICRRLVALMGGRVALDSAPGRGSVVSFDIPLRPAAPAAPAAAELAQAIAPEEPRGRVLLVEDGEASGIVAAAMLRKAGHVVDRAHDGREALAAARSAAYDLC